MTDNTPIENRWSHYVDIELAIGGEIWIDARNEKRGGKYYERPPA